MINSLDLLFLEVNNLDDSLIFYHDRLGLSLEAHQPEAEPPIATLRAGSLRITLVQQLETMLKRGRGVHFVLSVEDVDKFHQQLTAGGEPLGEPKDEGWGGRFINIQDPDGYRLFFVTWDRLEQAT